MNTKQIIGLALIVVAFVLYFYFENDLTDFLSGLGLASGIGLLISGQLKSKKSI